MTLGFTQTIGGKPNYFVDKICVSLLQNELMTHQQYLYMCQEYRAKFGKKSALDYTPPKHHTIRLDPHGRWKAGIKIHPVINNRTKDRFQFAPTIACKSVQRIDIDFLNSSYSQPTITIDDKIFYADDFNYRFLVRELSDNDGFESVEDFFEYFKDGITDGKLIHWTDKRY